LRVDVFSLVRTDCCGLNGPSLSYISACGAAINFHKYYCKKRVKTMTTVTNLGNIDFN